MLSRVKIQDTSFPTTRLAFAISRQYLSPERRSALIAAVEAAACPFESVTQTSKEDRRRATASLGVREAKSLRDALAVQAARLKTSKSFGIGATGAVHSKSGPPAAFAGAGAAEATPSTSLKRKSSRDSDASTEGPRKHSLTDAKDAILAASALTALTAGDKDGVQRKESKQFLPTEQVIDLDAFLWMAVDGWYEQAGEDQKELVAEYQAFDEDGNGRLSFEEFKRLIVACVGQPLPLSRVMALFEEVSELDGPESGDEVSAAAFATLCSSYGITPSPRETWPSQPTGVALVDAARRASFALSQAGSASVGGSLASGGAESGDDDVELAPEEEVQSMDMTGL